MDDHSNARHKNPAQSLAEAQELHLVSEEEAVESADEQLAAEQTTLVPDSKSLQSESWGKASQTAGNSFKKDVHGRGLVSGKEISSNQASAKHEAIPVPPWWTILSVFMVWPFLLLSVQALIASVMPPIKVIGLLALLPSLIIFLPGPCVIYWSRCLHHLHTRLRELNPQSKVWSSRKAILANCLQGWGLMTGTGILLALGALVISSMFGQYHHQVQSHQLAGVGVTMEDRWLSVKVLSAANLLVIVLMNLLPTTVAVLVYSCFNTTVEQINSAAKSPRLSKLIPLIITSMIAVPPYLLTWFVSQKETTSIVLASFLLFPLFQIYAFAQLRTIIKAANEVYDLKDPGTSTVSPKRKALICLAVTILTTFVATSLGGYPKIGTLLTNSFQDFQIGNMVFKAPLKQK